MLYLIRHGQTNLNKTRRWNCQSDEDINEEGIKQAEAAADAVEKLPLDLILCSPLIRTRHTCEIINRNHVPVIYDKRLMERCGGIITGQPYEYYDHDLYYNLNTKDFPEGMEPLSDFMGRVHELLKEVEEKYREKNVLLVTHGGVSRCVKYYFEPIPENGAINKDSKTQNCEIRAFAFGVGEIKMEEQV
ncbi:MAG: histidine phosphatase family protein [Lachnospiraceae bacterium]|nr:histidine phosphatase family protein [Lachnospiraceae bacterium]